MYSTISRDAKSLRLAVTDIYDELSLERIRIENGCKVVPEERTETEIRQMIRERTQRDAEAGLPPWRPPRLPGTGAIPGNPNRLSTWSTRLSKMR